MSLVLELPADLQSELAAEAARAGLPLEEYAVRLLARGTSDDAKPATGAELVAYWQAENLIGTRPDICDAAAHARSVRGEAERRAR